MPWLLLFTFITCHFSACYSVETYHPQGLSVTGNAILLKPADLLSITLGIVTEDDDAERALVDNSTKMHQLIYALNQVNIDKSEYETSQFTITPLYTATPKNPPPNWQTKIRGYRVTNNLILNTEKLSMAGKIIDIASGAGANSIGNIEFSIKDSRDYRSEAIEKAAEYAKKDAQILAEAMGVTLTGVRSVILDPQTNQAIFKRPLMRMSYDSSTPIEAGDIEVSAAVQVIYDIGD